MFDSLFTDMARLFTPDRMITVVKIALIVVIGMLVVRLIIFSTKRSLKNRLSPQSIMIIRKLIFYTGMFVMLILVLKQLNVKLAAILGAAGIAGVAIGFSAQTSLSNIISGFFLISEKAFAVGDVIRVDGQSFVVLSVDILSVKARTFDNMFVRIPNEKLIKSVVTNITKFPIRRLNVDVSVAYKEDLAVVQEMLLDIAAGNPYCLANPAPLFVIKDFGDSGIDLMLGCWFIKTDYLLLKNSIMQEIKKRFDENGIQIPFPHISVYAGTASDAFPISLRREEVSDKPKIES
jgi:small-conductance mechanosensitive channel